MPIKDLHIWEHYTRHVEPARGKKAALPVAARSGTQKIALQRIPQSVKAAPPTPRTAKTTVLPSPAFNRKREKALRQGEIEIDAALDLHGMTQEKAFAALATFICRNVAAGKRNLLVITGKGRDGEGVLRRNLKNWLETLPDANRISAFRPAGIKHGGSGAFYVLLKKRRPDL